MKIDLLGVKIDALTKNQVLAGIKTRLLEDSRPIFIATPYSESIVTAQKNENFRAVLNSSDFALPDGIGLLWAVHFLHSPSSPGEGRSRRRGRRVAILWQLVRSLFLIILNPSSLRQPIPEKISGSEFVWDLAALAEKNNYSIFLLGGYGDTPERAGECLQQRFPNLKIAGTAKPVIAKDKVLKQSQGKEITSVSDLAMTSDLITQINSSRADFLFVALGPVRQEKWIFENLPNLRVKLAIGLGGTFDYLAAKRPYRPKFWASNGLEWLWRLLTQPWRVGRIIKGVAGLIYCAFKFKLKRV